MIRYVELPYEWRPLDFQGAQAVSERALDILEGWEGTPYISGQDRCQTGADCIGFGFRVIDELYRREPLCRPKLPPDTAMHNRIEAARTMHRLRKLYATTERVRTPYLQPLDLIVVGPKGGGPGHLILVGPRRNTLWQAIKPEVCWTGWALPDEWRIFRIYRFQDRERWI